MLFLFFYFSIASIIDAVSWGSGEGRKGHLVCSESCFSNSQVYFWDWPSCRKYISVKQWLKIDFCSVYAVSSSVDNISHI